MLVSENQCLYVAHNQDLDATMSFAKFRILCRHHQCEHPSECSGAQHAPQIRTPRAIVSNWHELRWPVPVLTANCEGIYASPGNAEQRHQYFQLSPQAVIEFLPDVKLHSNGAHFGNTEWKPSTQQDDIVVSSANWYITVGQSQSSWNRWVRSLLSLVRTGV